MVAGDLVNTAARLQSVAPARDRPRRRGDAAGRRRRRSRSSPPASSGSRASRRPSPAWRALRVVAERGGRGRSRRARGAVRRPRRRAPAAQGPVPRDGARAAGAARVDHRAGRHRQEPARLGVREVPRRPRRDRLLARRAARRPTARASRSGRWARWSAAAPGSPRPTTSRRPGAKVAETLDALGPRRGGAALDRAGAARAARPATPRPRRPARSCSRPGGRSSSGSRPQGTVVLVFEDLHWADSGHARLHRPPARLVRGRADPRRHAGAARSCSSAARTGAPAGATSSRSASSRSSEAAMRELLAGLVPGLPAAAVRAIIERADGIPLYAVETVRMLVADGRLVPRRRRLRADGRPGRRSPSRRRCTRSSPPVWTRSTPADRRSSRTRRSSGRASPPTGSPRSAGSTATGASSRARPVARPARAARPSKLDPRSAGTRPVRLRPGAHPRGRLRDPRPARPARPPPRRGPLLRVARRGRARRRPRAHYLAAYRAAPDGPEPAARGAGADRAPRGRRPGERARRHDQAVTFLTEAIEVTDDPTEIAELLERAGEAAVLGGPRGTGRAAPPGRDPAA